MKFRNAVRWPGAARGIIGGLAVIWLSGCARPVARPSAGPWDLRELSRPPSVQWGSATGLVQSLFYAGEPFQGKPTRVFAYLGRPASLSPSRTRPAMVLVHGGGGTAFKEWAEHWARNGYVALAMDLAGQGPAGRLPDGGPGQADPVKFRNFEDAEVREMWTYHAVAAVVRGHSLLRSLPDVDPGRTGITGISWGGYLTCIVAGIDPRFKVAVPVYGCGFLGDNSVWRDGSLAAMSPEARARWLRWFDPSHYVGSVRVPILFVNGTTDFAYPLDSYQKTYRLVPERWRQVSVAVNRPHGHIWTFPEVDAFVGAVLMGKPRLPRVGAPVMAKGALAARISAGANVRNVQLCYTSDSGAWQKRAWRSVPARVEEGWLHAELPTERPLVAFFSLQDSAGNQLSSEHVETSHEPVSE